MLSVKVGVDRAAVAHSTIALYIGAHSEWLRLISTCTHIDLGRVGGGEGEGRGRERRTDT